MDLERFEPNDAENRLVGVSGGGVSASFAYDGDGHRVKATFNGTTTVYVGSYYEKTGRQRNAERRMMNAERAAERSSFRILHSSFGVGSYGGAG